MRLIPAAHLASYTLSALGNSMSAGLKFTFGTNGRNHNAGTFHYGPQIAHQAGLTPEDMFTLETR